MFYSLKGKIAAVEENNVAIETSGGEGYTAYMSKSSLAKLSVGSDIKILVRLFVREDAMELFGFLEEDEKTLFDLLNTVSGVGPRAAMAILALGPTDQIKSGIADGKADILTKSFGIGKKTAERIIVELRDKVGPASEKSTDWDDDVYDALVKLGYRRENIKEAMKKIDPDLKTTGERLKDAMKKMR